MRVLRVVPDLAAEDPAAARAFYEGALGMTATMDMGWIVTFGEAGGPQGSVMSEGGSGAPVPAVSIEVDDLDEALRRVRESGAAVEYGPATEPWGVRRFFARDPAGRLVNVLSHAEG